MTSYSKIKNKKNILLHFDPIIRVSVLRNGVEDTPLQQLFERPLHV